MVNLDGKHPYESVKLEVLRFAETDIISTSGEPVYKPTGSWDSDGWT